MVVGWYGMVMWNDVNGFTVYSSQSNDKNIEVSDKLYITYI
jgi:hypothetical protein